MKDLRSRPALLDTLHAGFIASAARWPDRPALLQGEERWTYAAVDTAARRLAAGLLAISDAPKRVGILARRSFTSYTGVLGALFSGAAFIPLNPTLPISRLRAIAEAAELDAIICEDKHIALLRPLHNGRLPPVLLADASRRKIENIDGLRVLDSDDLCVIEPLRAPVRIAPDDIAYILFTSGTTGIPKGVPISHANAASFLNVNLARYLIEPEDVLSQTFEQSFDLSVFDIFMAWSAGASLYSFTHTELLAPLSVIQSRGITVWFSVPSMIAMQLRLGPFLPGSLPTLRLSLFCGEPLVREHAEAWQQAAPASVLENLYGPTELTIACAAHRWNRETSPGMCSNGIVPIGRLYEPLSRQIVDQDLEPVARGEIGELCVAGPQTFAGYWRNPEATAAAFYESTNCDGKSAHFYRTGDLVRELPNGELRFVGRRDHQIKLGGHRIELAEIEAALRAQPNVVEAAAFAWPPNATVIEKIVASVSGSALDGETLRRRLRSVLPAYMVPARIDIIETMPRTNSGKLDKRGLSDIVAMAVNSTEAFDAR
ncbi:amino acid adenylation domain-containing protein [uncultured Bradyrhizobium sp.]|uniref:amino acid adenylation domain-containing protein n=1 Tax=uncultured Bradyrhizobium sp. TaxID=199684 RepID=UPI0035CC29BA